MAVARLGYEIDSTGVVRAVGDLDAMSAAAGRADRAQNVLSTTSSKASNEMFTLSGAVSRAAASITSSQQSANIASASFTGLGADVAATARETELLNREMNALRARFNPLFAVSQRYEQELRDIAEAERLGAISAIEAAQARDRASQILQGTTAQVRSFGNAVGGGASQVANLGAQLNDIGVMLAAGQNPLQLAVQQGTQINQVFAQMGGGKAALRGLAAGFMSMVNPMSLATIGIIAGGAALVQWAVAAAGAGRDADNLEAHLDALADIMDLVEQSTDVINTSTDELIQKYGMAANRVREFALAQAELAQSQAERRLRDQVGLLDVVVDRYGAVGEAVEIAGYRMENDLQLANIQRDLKVSADQAFILMDAFTALGNASTFKDQQDALSGILATMEDQGVALSLLPPELQEAISEMITLSNEADAARAAMDRLAGAAANVTVGVPLFLQGFSGRGLLPPETPERRGRGGGGGKTEAQRHKEEQEKILEQLRERQSSETMLQLQAYARDQEALKFALNNQAITREEYRDRLEALRIENFGSQFEQDALQYELEQQALEVALDRRLLTEEQYQQRLRELREANSASGLSITQDFFGQAATLMQSGNAKLFKIGQAAAIANAIVSGHSAAVAAWEKGMQAGGPPLAAAYTALSVAKTASQIAAIRSASSSGGGSSGGSASPSGITAESNQQQQQQTRAIIQVQGLGRTRFSVDEINEIIQGIQDASDDGVIIEGVQLT